MLFISFPTVSAAGPAPSPGPVSFERRQGGPPAPSPRSPRDGHFPLGRSEQGPSLILSLSLCPLVNAVVVCRWRRHREDANEREIVNRDERIGLDLIGGNAIAPIVRKFTRVIGGILTGGSALFLMRNNRY